MDSLEERQKTFFANCAKNKTKGSEREEYEGIRKEYQKVNFLLLSETKAQILVNNKNIFDTYAPQSAQPS